MLFKLAWRNIWRSKRRTIITVSAVFFAVFISSILQSFQKGTWDNVIENSINSFFGYAQVHGLGSGRDCLRHGGKRQCHQRRRKT